MIRIKLYLKDINYNSFVDIVMPYLLKWLSDKDNVFLDVFSKMISKNGKSSSFSKFLVSLIPNKERLVASILPHYDTVLIEYINDMLKKNNIIAKVKKIDFMNVKGSNKDMLKIEVAIKDIDYEQTIVNLTPVILQKMAEQDSKASKIAQLLLSREELPVNILKAAVGAIPKEQRDELISEIFMEYKEEITESLNMVITNNNIKAELFNINMKGSNNSTL